MKACAESIRTHTFTYAFIRTHAHTHSHTHSHALIHTHIHIHVHTHSCTHTFTYTFIRTHAQMHHINLYSARNLCDMSRWYALNHTHITHTSHSSLRPQYHPHHIHTHSPLFTHTWHPWMSCVTNSVMCHELIHPYSHTHDILGCHVSRTLSCVTNSFTLIHTHMTSFLIHPQALILTHSIWTASYSYAFILKSHTHDVLPHSSIRTQSWSHHILTHPSLVTHTWHPSSFIHTHSILSTSCSYASHTHDVLYPHMHMMSSVWHVCA